jgi:hypothetical protein
VAGLRERGVTVVHRRTYQRIRAILEGDQLAFDLDDALLDDDMLDVEAGGTSGRLVAVPVRPAGAAAVR